MSPRETGRERAWWVVAFVAGTVSFLKGARAPIRWAATQALIDYRFGIVKRGFFGNFVSRPLHLQIYQRFAWFSFGALLVMFALLAVYVAKSGLLQRLTSGEALVLFSSSIAVSYLGQLNGYFEIPLCALTVAVLLIRNEAVRFWISLPVIAIAIAIHENYLLLFLPVVLLSFLLQGEGKTKGKRWARVAVPGLVGIATALVFSLRPSLTVAQAAQFRDRILREADTMPALIFFDILTRSLRDNLHIMAGMIRMPFWWHYQEMSLLEMGPTILLLVYISLQLLRHARARRAVRYAAVGASLSPLALHVLGWDVGRWNALTILSSFLVLLTTCAFLPPQVSRLSLSHNVRLALFTVCMLNMAAGAVLLGDAPVRQFPFIFGKHSVRMLLPRHWSPMEPTPDHP